MKHQNFAVRTKQKGVTLIELLLGIGIILVIIGVGIVIYNQVNTSSSSYQSSSGIMNLNAAVKSLHPRPDYLGVSSLVVTNSGKAPSNMVVGTGPTATLVGNWGGTITVEPIQYAGSTTASTTACSTSPCNAFRITYPNVPQDACTTLVSGMEANFDFIAVGSTIVKHRLGSAAQQKPTAASITSACAATANATLQFANT